MYMNEMHFNTLPNYISFLRIPLAFLFLTENPMLRFAAIFLAMISDGLDGFIARRTRSVSKFGILFDPFADKFFVIFVLSVLLAENRLTYSEAAAFLCRDVSVFIFGLYLSLKGLLGSYRFRAIWCGKVTTFLQFIFLLGLTLHIPIPPYGFISFIILGFLALIELALPLPTKQQ